MMLAPLLHWLLEAAHAQQPPPTPCPITLGGFGQAMGLFPGCPGVVNLGNSSNILVTTFLPNVALFMLRLVGALAVAAIVWYGLMLVLNAGDETKATKARWGILYAVLGIGLSVVSQLIVSFVATGCFGVRNPNNPFCIDGSGDLAISVIGSAVGNMLTLINIAFLFMILYYGVRMVYAQGKTDEYTRMRTGIAYSIVGAIVVNLAHAVVRIAASFFGF